MQRIEEINRIEELEPYRAAWDGLLAQTPGGGFFQSLAWLEAYWRHFGRGQQLRVVVVLDADRPQGIVPLVTRTDKTRLGTLRFLTYPLDFWGSYYGPIGPEPGKTLAAALAYLRTARRDWDVLELRWVGGPDDDGRATEQALIGQGFQACRTVLDRTAIVRLGGTWEQYLAGRGSKWRGNFRRWVRKLEQLGTVTHLRYRPRGEAHGEADPRWDLYETCLDIAARSWQGSSPNGTTLTHDQIRPFLREAHAAAVRLGCLDLNLLLIDGTPAAFAYNYVCGGHVYGLRAGYDRQVSRDGIGNLLYARAVEDSFRRGDRTYDFGVGYLACKRRFQTEIRPILRFSHFPWLTLRGQLLRLKRHLDRRLTAASL